MPAAGAEVTGVDASAQMLDVARERARAEGLAIDFREGDAHDLAFPDRSFDAAVSLRVLMHTPDWRRCLAELCRVARERVVFDYPALVSAAALQAAGRRVAAAIGSRTEAYRVFRAARCEPNWRDTASAWPPSTGSSCCRSPCTRRSGRAASPRASSAALTAAGLLRLFGSPVTVVAVREGGR